MNTMLSKRGASEVIAALLMIMITVSAALLLYGYSSGVFGRLQGRSGNQPYTQGIALEYYDWSTLSSLSLKVRNIGATNVNLQNADYFVNGLMTTASVGTCASSSSTAKVVPQDSCPVTLTVSAFTPSNGIAYVVKIITPEGAVFSYSCVAGQIR